MDAEAVLVRIAKSAYIHMIDMSSFADRIMYRSTSQGAIQSRLELLVLGVFHTQLFDLTTKTCKSASGVKHIRKNRDVSMDSTSTLVSVQRVTPF